MEYGSGSDNMSSEIDPMSISVLNRSRPNTDSSRSLVAMNFDEIEEPHQLVRRLSSDGVNGGMSSSRGMSSSSSIGSSRNHNTHNDDYPPAIDNTTNSSRCSGGSSSSAPCYDAYYNYNAAICPAVSTTTGSKSSHNSNISSSIKKQ